MYCRSTIIVKGDRTVRKAVTVPCRSWHCPDCAPQRKSRLTAEARRGQPNTFITLTCKRNLFDTPEQAAKELSNAWRIVRKRALREAARDTKKHRLPFGAAPPEGWSPNEKETLPNQVKLDGGKLEFLAVIEKHKSGWPHIHILARSRWIAHRWLSAQMLDVIGSKIVWIERIDQASKAVSYCAKYCSKATEKIGSAKRYWQSKCYQLTKHVPRVRDDHIPGKWERDTMGIIQWIKVFRELGWTVEHKGDHAIARAPP